MQQQELLVGTSPARIAAPLATNCHASPGLDDWGEDAAETLPAWVAISEQGLPEPSQCTRLGDFSPGICTLHAESHICGSDAGALVGADEIRILHCPGILGNAEDHVLHAGLAFWESQRFSTLVKLFVRRPILPFGWQKNMAHPQGGTFRKEGSTQENCPTRSLLPESVNLDQNGRMNLYVCTCC